MLAHKQAMHDMIYMVWFAKLARQAPAMLQIDEFIKTGTFAALNEAKASVAGGDAPQKQKAVQSKAQDLAAKFL